MQQPKLIIFSSLILKGREWTFWFFIKEEMHRDHRLLWFMAGLPGVRYGLDWHEAAVT